MNIIGTAERIEKYFGGKSQYPLLVVVSYDEYSNALSKFSQTHKIRVSSYCIGGDKDPDIKKLEEDVREFEGNALLLGLGEYLANRVPDSEKRSILTAYTAMVLKPESHIAVLLSAHMFHIVEDIVRNDLRVKDRVKMPANAPQITAVENSKLVYDGIKEYLEACEDGKAVNFVKTTLKISAAAIINPESTFDELKHRFPNEFSKLSRENGSPDNWSMFLIEVNKTNKNILQYLHEQKFESPEYIFLDHAKSDDYKSWLFFIWLKLKEPNSGSYLDFTTLKAKSFDSLLDTAKSAILEISVSDSRFKDFYNQRKKLLKDCADADMADFTQKVYCRGVDRLAYLTDNTKVEKQAIIISLAEGAKSDYLKISYPALYDYLQDCNLSDNNLTAYFNAYKKCKVENRIDDAFADMVKSNAENRPYNKLPSRTSIFSGIPADKTLLIFLDAMGAEFLGYVKEACVKLKLRFVSKIARANLPTITGANKEFYDDWQGGKYLIKGLDDLKHNPERGYDFNNSSYPIHLAEELDVIYEALERAKTELSKGEYRKVIIASDHGASRLAVINPDIKIDSGSCQSKSSGRYCQGDLLPCAENVVTENDYAVIADYSRFNGSRAASVEVHGGATLEEIVVPIIELTLYDKSISVDFENGENIIEISYNKTPELILIITPDCDAVTATAGGFEYEAEKLSKSRFKVSMPQLKKGVYILDVFENQNKIASKEFTIKNKGITERTYF